MQQELFMTAIEWATGLTTYQFATLRNKAPEVWGEIGKIRAETYYQTIAAEMREKRKLAEFKAMQDDINRRLINSLRRYV
jgi:hypothetical protein